MPLIALDMMLCVRRRTHPALVCALCFGAMIAGSFVLAKSVLALDSHLLAEIDKYEHGTPEALRASEEWASDTDRSSTFVLSPLLTGFWYLALFLLFFGLQWIVRRMFPGKAVTTNSEPNVATGWQQGDDGNPSQPPIIK